MDRRLVDHDGATSGRAWLERALWAMVTLACLAAIGTMLILPDDSKVVDIVYGGF